MIGMSGLEPFGAVILVSGSGGSSGLGGGINPVHFWILGTDFVRDGVPGAGHWFEPPVDSTHNREKEVELVAAKQKAKLLVSNERYIFPMCVMVISMLGWPWVRSSIRPTSSKDYGSP